VSKIIGGLAGFLLTERTVGKGLSTKFGTNDRPLKIGN
jgi:hypothetical protein